MTTFRISVAEDFSRYPAGRTRRDGEFSGQRFREDYLVPNLQKAIRAGDRLVVVLDGVYGYSSSFLEEAFGGVVRSGLFSPEQIEHSLVIEAENPIYASAKIDAESYIADELRRVPA